jgi:hypothetical protein
MPKGATSHRGCRQLELDPPRTPLRMLPAQFTHYRLRPPVTPETWPHRRRPRSADGRRGRQDRRPKSPPRHSPCRVRLMLDESVPGDPRLPSLDHLPQTLRGVRYGAVSRHALMRREYIWWNQMVTILEMRLMLSGTLTESSNSRRGIAF